jgi:hypothetical protein
MILRTVFPAAGNAGDVQITRVALEAETGAEVTTKDLEDISNWQRYVFPVVVAKFVPKIVTKKSPPNRPVVGDIDCHEATCAFTFETMKLNANSERARWSIGCRCFLISRKPQKTYKCFRLEATTSFRPCGQGSL